MPPPSSAPPRLGALQRCTAFIVALAALSVLVLAGSLTPDPRGFGTHEQLGMSRCGVRAVTGRPCPTCSMTTAFARAAHADPVGSFVAQPMGFILALAVAAAFWTALHAATTGSRVGAVAGKLLRPYVLWGVAALWAASWVYKLVQAA